MRGVGNPGWVFPGAMFDFDFRNLRSYGAPVTWRSSGNISAGPSAVMQGNGLTACHLPAADVLFRLCTGQSLKIADGIGLACFDNSTFYALHNRDLTNAVWAKTNCTAARAIGADLMVNSGSRLTATAANATCAQAIIQVSRTHLMSIVVKRVTGTGAIKLSVDGGATSTVIEPTAGHTQIAVPHQTVTNLQVVIGMATSGDVIDVDFVALQEGGNLIAKVPGPPVAVTTVAINRFREINEISNGRGGGGYANGATGERFLNIINSGQAALYVEYMGTPRGTPKATTTDGVQFGRGAVVGSPADGPVVTTSNVVLTGFNKFISGYVVARAAGGGGAIGKTCLNGGPVAMNTNASISALNTTHLVIGGNGSGANAIHGYVARITLWDQLVDDAEMQRLTGLRLDGKGSDFKSLDGLRGVAAITVMVYRRHFWFSTEEL